MNPAQQQQLEAQRAQLAQALAAREAEMRNAAQLQGAANVQHRLAADAQQRKAAEDNKLAQLQKSVDELKAKADAEVKTKLTEKFAHLLIDSKHLTVGKELGSGAFATVYEGVYGQFGRVAIKDVKRRNPAAAGLLHTIGAVSNEVEVMQYLSAHERMDTIVRFHGFAVDQATQSLRLVMDLAPGRPLNDILHGKDSDSVVTSRSDQKDSKSKAFKPVKLSDNQVLVIAERLAQGIAWLHSKRCVHRDLKPHNIVVDLHTLSVRILDFGIARILPEGRTFDDQSLAAEQAMNAANLAAIHAAMGFAKPNPAPASSTAIASSAAVVAATASPSVPQTDIKAASGAAAGVNPNPTKPPHELSIGVGTLLYIAPEVFTSGAYDERCDVWAYGMILWELLTGTYGFLDPNLSGEEIQTRLQNGHTPSSFLDEVLEDQSHPLRAIALVACERRKQMPTWLWQLMEECLNLDANKRITSAMLPSVFTKAGAAAKPSVAATDAALMQRAVQESLKSSLDETLNRSELEAVLIRSKEEASLLSVLALSAKQTSASGSGAVVTVSRSWSCASCTYVNAIGVAKCVVCSTVRIATPAAKLKPVCVCPGCGKSAAGLSAAFPALTFEDHVEFCLVGATPV